MTEFKTIPLSKIKVGQNIIIKKMHASGKTFTHVQGIIFKKNDNSAIVDISENGIFTPFEINELNGLINIKKDHLGKMIATK